GYHWSAERDVMLKPAILANHYLGPDYTVRPDDCSRANFCSGINDRGRMNLRVAHACQPLTSILSPSFNGRGGKGAASLYGSSARTMRRGRLPLLQGEGEGEASFRDTDPTGRASV